ncbi:MAG: penicillin-insensitive murein endopeptidase [Deltaproteobacteria bacterium]|nr:penicillin-insensitive murein endopeptidase [Deltaproteobacteria bacterium]
MKYCFIAAAILHSGCAHDRNVKIAPAAEKKAVSLIRLDSCAGSGFAGCAAVSDRREIEPKPFTLPLPLTQRWHPKIGKGAKGSVSIGTATDGYLVNQREMPLKSDFHAVLPKTIERMTYFGTDDVVEAVLDAAAAVNKKYPGSVMRIGNISKGGGGDLEWSASHNSGRDADIAFYMTDNKGKQALPDDLVELDSNGVYESDEGEFRFDVRKNWIVVKSLLNNKNISVQWLFISVPLKRMLLAHAQKIKEPKDLIKRADLALNQPIGSKPHNDHLHLRIYCPKDDVLDGCRNNGSDRPWANHFIKEYKKRIFELSSLLKSKETETISGAIHVLGKMGAGALKGKIAGFLNHPEKTVRGAALDALFEIDPKYFAKQAVSLVKNEDDAGVMSRVFGLLIKAAGEETALLIVPLLGDARKFLFEEEFFREEFSVRQKAAEIIGISDTKTGAGAIIQAIDGFDGGEFITAYGALQKITNFKPEIPSEGAENPAEHKKAVAQAYKDWFASNGKKDHDKWLVDGFKKKGYAFKKIDSGAVPQLINALKDEDHIAYNANKLLFKITKRRIPSQLFQPIGKYAFWHDWLK